MKNLEFPRFSRSPSRCWENRSGPAQGSVRAKAFRVHFQVGHGSNEGDVQYFRLTLRREADGDEIWRGDFAWVETVLDTQRASCDAMMLWGALSDSSSIAREASGPQARSSPVISIPQFMSPGAKN